MTDRVNGRASHCFTVGVDVAHVGVGSPRLGT
jgi:hypothetical protein